ncbi:MAG: DUF4928 family protein [Thermodesulfobacteriota bacterium]
MGTCFTKRRIKATYNSKIITWKLIHYLLNSAIKNKKEVLFAKYIIGASLHLTFPDIIVANTIFESFGDPNIPFDYCVGDTAFNITTSQICSVCEKCKSNIDSGLRSYLIVPEKKLCHARESSEEAAPGKIAVESIESFVSQNLEELSDFSKDRLAHGFYRLLETYNQRVDTVEVDKSMLIEIPRNLAHYADKE